ncbi:stress protein [Elizabethkingia miricola]|uniref:Stress protein n=1 Tax=Elizabethkingia miricola TaxID=172045 RepID=A0ABD4DIK3_ELIMR|nr:MULTISPECIES: glycosyltransferase family 8 protein [Elizabethkingia]KUY16961.1 stress protein [Elizabethkingia miricola]MCL1654755.1 glycosyltransferase family 8 protein [Elizabethkingia miricola]MCL1680499.1 glycosyltransferase family 8 protein [Elizabethkingia miricola]OPC72489.1 stress protein [Elizabethkingia miricola]OPC76307.1 stress protein [Elizabethkingia miricola]
MSKIPIVFCFDDNLLMPAGVCLTSLLEHANPDTFYDIFILHDNKSSFPKRGYLEKLNNKYQNFNITYRNVGNAFENAFEIRGITVAAYYRLVIPEVIPEYDKIFYFDVDIIFRRDLSDIFKDTDLTDYYVAGVATPYSDLKDYINNTINMEVDKYICSGTIILNSKKILQDNIISKFKETAQKSWKYQDQDVLNKVCQDKIKLLSPWFGVVGTINEITGDPNQKYYNQEDLNSILESGTIHYNGAKPWKGWCYNFDIWWEYYRKSIFFDPKFYFEFYHSKLTEYDRLSLWKRVKILLRYFKTRL